MSPVPALMSIPVVSGRPNISLVDDGSEDFYKLKDGFDCLLSSNEFKPECWTVLKMNDWLQKWSDSVGFCSAPNEEGCRFLNESWGIAFLGLAEGGQRPNCDRIKMDCVYQSDENNVLGENSLLTARYSYGRYNIYGKQPHEHKVGIDMLIPDNQIAIHDFFASWYDSQSLAMDRASNTIGAIINLIDEVHKTNVLYNAFLTVLGLSLSLIPVAGPELTATFTTGKGFVLQASKLAFLGIKNAPSVGAALWPRGTDDTREIQIETLQGSFDGLGGVRDIVLQNLEEAYEQTIGKDQGNVSSFLAFAGDGDFSVRYAERPSSLDLESYLLLGATTFLVSTALGKNGWRAVMVPGVDPQGLTSGTTPCPQWATTECSKKKGMFRCTRYDGQTQCDEGHDQFWWYSKAQNSAFALRNVDRTEDSSEILRRILANNWSTGKLLFENAAVCTMRNAFPETATNINYTIVDGRAGFLFDGNFKGAGEPFNQTAIFLSLEDFPQLSTVPATFLRLQNNKDNGLIDYTEFQALGNNPPCVSQLNITIANSWGDPWDKNDP